MEDERRDFSCVPITLGQKFFTSELSKVIRQKILWIRLYWTTCWVQITSSSSSTMSEVYLNMHSISASGLIARGKHHGRYRQTVFFTDVDPMNKKWIDQKDNTTWESPDTLLTNKPGKYVKMKDIGLIFVVHKWMGLKFFQTRSSAITLHDTLPPICIERVVSRKSEEVLYTNIV